MKNITLSVDEDVLDAVRVIAAKRKTSVNALVRAELKRIADAENRVALARARIRELAGKSEAGLGDIAWTRDDLHER